MSDIKLSPAQAQLLVESYKSGFVTNLSRRTARTGTARRLVELGLAKPAMGRLYRGGPIEPVSVWGGELTDMGRLLAEALMAKGA